jgi:pyrroline-5-carboxylate reductase
MLARMRGTILLVGCGKMGGALLEGWFKRGANPVDVMVIEPAGRGEVGPCGAHPALTCLAKAGDIPRDFHPDVVVFAVKPQIFDQAIPEYRRFEADGAVFLSVIAGKTTAALRAHLGATAEVVRAMPNTPAIVGKGITVCYAAPGIDEVHHRIAEVLMAAVGRVTWITDESLMDAVTAVSGSGPAYVFLLAECLEEAAVAAGLPPSLAAELARATVAGAGAMLGELTDPASTMRSNVTSPGGTTQAALQVLMGADGLKHLMTRAVAAAAERSRELGR